VRNKQRRSKQRHSYRKHCSDLIAADCYVFCERTILAPRGLFYFGHPALGAHSRLVHSMQMFRFAEVFALIVAMVWIVDLTRAFLEKRHKH
jgi:hypothetical protein